MVLHTLRRPLASGAIVLALCAIPAQDLRALQQQPEEVPRWSVSAEGGLQLATSVYDQRVVMRVGEDFLVNTRYAEKIRPGPLTRVALRFRPQSLLGFFASVQFGSFGTEAIFAGGVDPLEIHERRARIWGAGAGVNVVLSRWADGRGVFEYSVAPTLFHHTIDLSRGHRNAFAKVPGANAESFDWSHRTWSSWGVTLGAALRIPVRDELAVRLGFHSNVVPVGTSALEDQDRADVARMTGRTPVFMYPSFTAYYPAIRLGVEYVIAREPVARVLPTIALPPPDALPETSPETRAAVLMAVQGDTAGAVAALRARTEQAPEDASAWRELALLLAGAAEENPAAREEAWRHLQRAITVNPGDPEILSAYGRVRSLMERGGAAPVAAPSLAVSGVNAEADVAGGVALAWAMNNLVVRGAAGARYRVQVQVFGPEGETVGLRLADSPDADPTTGLTVERAAPEPNVTGRLELRMTRAAMGVHTVRLRFTDLESGQAVERTAAFEIR